MFLDILCLFSVNNRFNQHLNLITTHIYYIKVALVPMLFAWERLLCRSSGTGVPIYTLPRWSVERGKLIISFPLLGSQFSLGVVSA